MIAKGNPEWEEIKPQVSPEAEFLEIVNDFGDPLEILREAISNSIDAHATWLKIGFDVKEIDGSTRSVITIADNGDGMTKDVLSKDFWGLGFSRSRERNDAIGEKGHGTKIYLRSENVRVRTQTKESAYESMCFRPLASLSRKEMHAPKWRTAEPFWPHTGTEIEIIGYNHDERSKFVLDVVVDYLQWRTALVHE